jgi:hypothetical protein
MFKRSRVEKKELRKERVNDPSSAQTHTYGCVLLQKYCRTKGRERKKMLNLKKVSPPPIFVMKCYNDVLK